MSEYGHFRAYLDPLGRVLLPDGRCRQEIELVLTDDPDRDPPGLPDPVLRLDAELARRLAQQLLALAWHADPDQRSGVAR
jgi:hypothetical protein